MKTLFHFILFCLFLSLPSQACNFCSSRPKPLSGGPGGITQDPGSANSIQGSSSAGAETQESNRGAKSPFSYDLKQYRPDGQRSSNEKWNSGDFFNNR